MGTWKGRRYPLQPATCRRAGAVEPVALRIHAAVVGPPGARQERRFRKRETPFRVVVRCLHQPGLINAKAPPRQAPSTSHACLRNWKPAAGKVAVPFARALPLRRGRDRSRGIGGGGVDDGAEASRPGSSAGPRWRRQGMAPWACSEQRRMPPPASAGNNWINPHHSLPFLIPFRPSLLPRPRRLLSLLRRRRLA